MVFGALVLRPRINYLLGSAIEVVLLAAVAHYAWTWPKAAPVRS